MLLNEILMCRALPLAEKIHLLDVGSCYDPFEKFADFVTVAIDISPAVEVCIDNVIASFAVFVIVSRSDRRMGGW